MKLSEFDTVVRKAEDLKLLGLYGSELCVRYTYPDGQPVVWSIPVSDIESATEDEVFRVLRCQRRPVVMIQISRIVGYYSMLRNWNASKLAELHDRHKGLYEIPEDMGVVVSGAPLPQDVVDEQLVGHADKAVCDIPKR